MLCFTWDCQKMKDSNEAFKYSKAFNEFLFQFLTPERMEIMKQMLENRTRYLTVAIEDIYQPHNASAVIRTCDCFGIQDLHIIEKRNQYKVNPKVALGSGQWVSVVKHNESENNSAACMADLKKRGYKIIATTPHTDDMSLYDLDLDQPVALVFGNEKEGISDTVREHADGFMRIPMYGFAESFNISVSVAICLSVLSEKLRQSPINWHLTEEEKTKLIFEWTQTRLGSIEKYQHEYLRMFSGQK